MPAPARFYECPIDIRGERYRTAKDACFDLLDTLSETKKDNMRVAVVGCGPAGIAAAAFLARRGCLVTVFDKSGRPGGAVQKYIPKFRIPDSDIEWDVTLMQALGVELELDHEVTSLQELRDLGYEHIVLAVGAEEPIPLKLAFGKSTGALEFLEAYKKNPDSLAESYVGNVGGRRQRHGGRGCRPLSQAPALRRFRNRCGRRSDGADGRAPGE
jgi:putative selenate reductase